MDSFDDFTSLEMRLVEKATINKTPLKATFEITPFCNFKCNMCYVRQSQKEIKAAGGLLRKDFWLRIADELQAMGCLFILITGGEPLTHPDFIDIYKGLKKRGFFITINTNGSLMSEELIEMFKNDPPRRLNVTLYGSSNETYKELCHRTNGFDETSKALKLIKKKQIDCKINATVVKENLKDFPKIIKIAQELGLPLEETSYLFPTQRKGYEKIDILSSRVSPQDAALIGWDVTINKLGMKKEDFYVQRKNHFLATKKIIQNICLDCRAGKSACWINWKGDLTPCVFMEEPYVNIKYGNVISAWKEIVELSQHLSPITQCKGCELNTLCSICYAGATHELKATGNLNYLCEMTKEKLRLIGSV